MSNGDNLNIVSWNCNGILSKKNELIVFIQEHNPDIILLQETHLRPCNSFKLQNYTIVRNDYINPNSNKTIRGTAICVKDHLNFIHITPFVNNIIDYTGITLLVPGAPPVTFFSVYIPVKENTHQIMYDIRNLLYYDVNTFLAGDFNAHHTLWNCDYNCGYGCAIYNLIITSTVDGLFPDSPTHFTDLSSSTIDFGLYNGFNYHKEISSLPELSSDHNPIKIKIQIKTPPSSPKTINHVNWVQFTNSLKNTPLIIPPVNCPGDIDTLTDHITSEIKQAIDSATTIITLPEFDKLSDPHVRRLVTNKNRARKIYQRTHNISDKIIMNRAQQDLKNYLKYKRNQNWTNFLENLTPEDQSIWKAAKKFKSSVSPFPPILIPNSNTYAYCDEDKANAIATSLESQFQGNPIVCYETDREVTQTVRRFLSNFTPPEENFSVSNTDVYQQIKSLKKHKSPGISGITNEALKNLPLTYIPKITYLINNIFKHSYFPNYWKTAIIAPIHKSGKPKNIASSYRPISLLNSISKLTEAFIAQQLNNHIEENNLIAPEQFAFRKHLSAPHQVYRLVEHITTGKTQKETTAAVFLDIEKAFDKIWILALIYKLIILNFPSPLIYLIFSYLQDRAFHVRIKKTLSRKFLALFGLPQGSKISPTLFILYITDIPLHPSTKIAKFADDTCLFATNKNKDRAICALTRHLKLLSNWFFKWRIAINVNKTNAIIFGNYSREFRDRRKIKFRNTELPWSDDIKYLGVIIDQRLTFNKHIMYTRNKFRAVKNKLFPLIARNSHLSLKNKCLLYNSYLRPILTYSCSVWSYAAKSNIDLLFKAQNCTIRQIVNVPYYVRNTHIYNEIPIPKLNDYIQNLNINFHLTRNLSDNPALNELPNYDPTLPENRKRPMASLFLNMFV